MEAFSISNTGALTHVSSSNAGVDAADIVTNSKFVFVADAPSGLFPRPPIHLISYAVGSSGALTVADQEDFSNSDDTMDGIMLDPTGAHLYADSSAVATSGRVSTFALDNTSGKMTSQPPDVTSLPPTGRMAISPNGLLAYVATFTPHHTAVQPGIELLLRNPATGSLTDSGHRFHGSQPFSDEYSDLSFSAGGQYLLALDFTRKITVFAVNPATGDLTVASELNGNLQGMTVDRTGKFVVVTDDTGTVASYRINSDGTLSIQGTATAAAGVRHLTMDAGNKFVYVQNNSAPQIFGFTFDPSSGALVAIPGSPFTAAAQPIRMTAVGR